MALSYLQEAQINAGLLSSQQYDMKQDSKKQSLSPPLNNNTDVSLFPRIGAAAAAAAASLSILTPQQFLAASRTAALMAAGLPVQFHPTLAAAAAANPVLYAAPNQPMSMFAGWSGQSSSPPLHHKQGPLSPALSTKSTSRRANNNNNNNNNNIVSSSADRIMKSKANAKKRGPKSKIDINSPITETSAPPSPPTSISPEATKDSRDKVFTCGVCSRSFGYKHVLQNHERTHTGEKPFECPECHKRFTRDHHLKTHMRLHTGEKPYHCSHCDRQFVQVANLRRHLRVHTGERPYACEMCSAKFSDSNQLRAHVLIHRGEKPFECEQCQMRFRRKHHFLQHKCGFSSNRSQRASPSVASDDLDEEIDIDIEAEIDDSSRKSSTSVRSSSRVQHRLPSPVVDNDCQTPLNLTSAPIDIPEQTEPEDLSMSTGRVRPHSHSHSSGGSPMSQSPSSDNGHDDEDDDLDVSHSSPSLLILRQRDDYRQRPSKIQKIETVTS